MRDDEVVIVMPQMGESAENGIITRWLVEVGGRVEKDQPLFEIATDKVDAEIPSPASGVLKRIVYPVGARVPVNTIVAWIGTEPTSLDADSGDSFDVVENASLSGASQLNPGASRVGGQRNVESELGESRSPQRDTQVWVTRSRSSTMISNQAERLKNLDSELRAKLRHVEYMSCYSVAVVRLVRARHFYAKVLVAIAGCIPFMAKVRDVSGESASWMAALIPLVAVVLPIWNPDRLVEVGSTLHGRYSELIPALRRLWRQVRDMSPQNSEIDAIIATAHEQLAAFEEQLASFHGEVAQLPDIGHLKERCARSIPKYDEPYVVRPMGEDPIIYGAPAPGL